MFDVRVTKDSGDDEKEKYIVLLKAEDVLGIIPGDKVTITIKLEADTDEIRRLFPKGSDYTVRLDPSFQRQLFQRQQDGSFADKVAEAIPKIIPGAEVVDVHHPEPLQETAAFADVPSETEASEEPEENSV